MAFRPDQLDQKLPFQKCFQPIFPGRKAFFEIKHCLVVGSTGRIGQGPWDWISESLSPLYALTRIAIILLYNPDISDCSEVTGTIITQLITARFVLILVFQEILSPYISQG